MFNNKSKKMLSREDILGAKDIQTVEVDVPEWGGAVLVKAMNGLERDKFEASMVEGKGKKQRTNFENLRARLVALSVVNENGQRIFNDADVAALGKKSSAALDRVFSKSQSLNGITSDDVDELIKNSETGQSGASISD